MIVINNHIIAVEPTDEQYEQVLELLKNYPEAPDGNVYMLNAETLEWELVELPPMPEPEDEPSVEDKAEAFDILTGVIE